MAKITVEIDDILQDMVDTLKGELKDNFEEFTSANPDLPANDWEPHDFITERADAMVPVYDKQLKDTYYLHSEVLEDAYRNSGIGDGTEENHVAVCIFCYLEDAMWRESRRLVDEAEDGEEEVA